MRVWLPAVSERTYAAVTVVLLHAAVGWALLQLEGVRKALREAGPAMLSFTVNTAAAPREHPVAPPRPKPVHRAVPPPVREAPPPAAAASEPLPEAPPLAPAPAGEMLSVPAAEPPAGHAAPVASLPVTPPDFGASYLRNPAPAYPLASRRLREQGRVLLRVYVTAQGEPEQVRVHESSGHARLDEAARDAVGRWRFVPAKQGTRALAAWVIVPVRFALEE
jgi:protein TonB